jgi:hypothetical protein
LYLFESFQGFILIPSTGVIYLSTSAETDPRGRLQSALAQLLTSGPALVTDSGSSSPATALFSLYYEQSLPVNNTRMDSNICKLPPPSLDLAFDDSTLDVVQTVYGRLSETLQLAGEYMVFKSREQGDDEEDVDM